MSLCVYMSGMPLMSPGLLLYLFVVYCWKILFIKDPIAKTHCKLKHNVQVAFARKRLFHYE